MPTKKPSKKPAKKPAKLESPQMFNSEGMNETSISPNPPYAAEQDIWAGLTTLSCHHESNLSLQYFNLEGYAGSLRPPSTYVTALPFDPQILAGPPPAILVGDEVMDSTWGGNPGYGVGPMDFSRSTQAPIARPLSSFVTLNYNIIEPDRYSEPQPTQSRASKPRSCPGIKFSCPIDDCARTGKRGFSRKDNLLQHRRNFHGQDIPKARVRLSGTLTVRRNLGDK